MADFGPRGVPWGPGPLLSPLGLAAWHRAQGASIPQIRAALALAFPSETPQQLGKVVSQFQRVEAVQERWFRIVADVKINRTDIPRDPNLLSAYQFIVNAVYRNQFGVIITARTLVIASSRNMGRDEVRAKAAEMLEKHFTDSRYERRVSQRFMRDYEIEPVLVTRRT